MKAIYTALIVLFAFCASAQAQAPKIKLSQQDAISYFQVLCPKMAKKGNARAKEILQQASMNGGKINLDPAEIIALIKKWDSHYGKNMIKMKFTKLYKAKLAEGDLDATALQQAANNNGKLALSLNEMIEQIKKWSE